MCFNTISRLYFDCQPPLLYKNSSELYYKVEVPLIFGTHLSPTDIVRDLVYLWTEIEALCANTRCKYGY